MRISLAPAIPLFVSIPLALADPLAIPNTFSNGEVADANKVNENFQALADSISGPAQVVWVATEGGDFKLLSAALNSITDASDTKPYVIKIAPGIYTETLPVELKHKVDVEGSGENITTISCSCNNGGVINAPNIEAELRQVTIQNTASSGNLFGIGTQFATPLLSLLHVTVRAEAGSGQNAHGVYNSGSSPTMLNVTAIASLAGTAYSVYNLSARTTMNQVKATGIGIDISSGVYNVSSQPTMTNVEALGLGLSPTDSINYGVYNTNSSSVSIRNSLLVGRNLPIITFSSSSATIAHTAMNRNAPNNQAHSCIGVYGAETLSPFNGVCD